jgi:hypothetical protein
MWCVLLSSRISTNTRAKSVVGREHLSHTRAELGERTPTPRTHRAVNLKSLLEVLNATKFDKAKAFELIRVAIPHKLHV